MLRKLLVAILVLALTSGAVGQQTAEDKQAAKVHARLEKLFNDGERAKLEMKDGRKIQGTVTELDAERFVLASGGRSETYSYADVKKVGRIGPSPKARKWVAMGVLGGLFGFIFWAAATQTR